MVRFRAFTVRRPRSHAASRPAAAPRSAALTEPLESRVLFVAGELDIMFSGDGRQTTNFGGTDTARAVVVQPDGKTVVAGDWDGGLADFAVARYDQGGNLDATFSGDGRANLTFGAPTFGGVERATGVALQADGKIVVVGYTDAGTGGGVDPFDFAVARFNADGTPDATFSGDGKFTHDFGNDDRAAAVAIQPDGKIVVAGSWDGGAADFAVIRLNPNGTFDTTFNDVALPNQFNGDGKLSVFFGASIASTSELATSVALTAGGKIVVGGYTNFGTTGGFNVNDFAVAVLNPNGTLDNTFSGDGKHTINYGWDDRANAVAVDRQNRIVLAGYDDGGSSDVAVARLTPAGNLDPTFNGSGLLTFNIGFAERAYGIALEPNGVDQEIYLAGYTRASPAGGDDFVLARVRPNGTLDHSFGGGDGIQVTDLGGSDQAYGAAIGADGKVVVAGTSGGDFAVVRHLAELDPAFGFDGKQLLNFGGTDTARAVAVQPDGKLVVAGDWDGGLADFAVARFLPTGATDATFNGTGRVNLTFGAPVFGGEERATAVALQADGKIVVAGYTDAGTTGGFNTFDFAVARFNADGSLDTTFDGDGKFTYDWGADDRVHAIVIQPDGKIVLAGQWAGAAPDFAVMRLNPNGSLDNTFSSDGRHNITFGTGIFGGDEKAYAVALAPGGKIVLAGYTDANAAAGNSMDFAVAVLNADGTPDGTFSGDGEFTIDFAGDDRASGVAVRPDGRIVVGGSSDDGTSDFAVAQIRGGVLDISFGGGDGKLELLVNDAVEFSTGLALMENGKIVMVGYSNSSSASPNNFVVARVLANGAGPDPSFNADGEHFIDFGADDRAYAVAIQPDRKVVVVGGSGGNFAVARLDSAPVVSRVYFNSTNWTPDFRSYLQSNGMGSVDFGYAIPPGGAQLNELPWYELNEVSVTFSEFVNVDFNDLQVRGVNVANYAFDAGVGAILTPSARTVTWRLPAGTYFAKDKLLLDLDGDSRDAVRTALGAVLDGDWATGEGFPSGDGAAGGDFRFRVNVLPGDTTGDGVVLAQDYADVKKKFFKNTASPLTGTDADYTPFHDLDGSGVILARDYAEVKKRFFDSLPGPNPAGLPPVPVAAEASSLFGTRPVRVAEEVIG